MGDQHVTPTDTSQNPLSRFNQFAATCVAGLAVLVVAGGVVRVTGSGLGCDDWPNCDDSAFLNFSSTHAAIEQGNRLLSAVVGAMSAVLAVWAFKLSTTSPRLFMPALLAFVTVLANGVLGGIAVRTDLHPTLVQSHFLLAMASIALTLLAHHRSRAKPPSIQSRQCSKLYRYGLALTALALVTGTVVTGAGPHAGDPSARRYAIDPRLATQIHSLSVLLAISIFGIAAVVATRTGPNSNGPVVLWLATGLLQGFVGYVQYFTDLPEVLVLIHLAGAVSLWGITVELAIRPSATLSQHHDQSAPAHRVVTRS